MLLLSVYLFLQESVQAVAIPLLAVLFVIVLAFYLHHIAMVRKGKRDDAAFALAYQEKKAGYHHLLDLNNPYYRSLDGDNKNLFLKRVLYFIRAKEFKYIDLEGEEIMPVLISATAIQLTFGLQHFLLDYFKTIYVLRNEYRYGFSSRPFEGHVNDEGIFLSWSNFMQEFRDYTDGENVGLHEMAHALTYVNFQTQEGVDDSFRSKFYAFSPIGRPVFERMKAGEKNLLDQYAASSYEEFWAVCIETFFERPFPFREQLPELYQALCTLLNQDPLSEAKVLGLRAAI